MPKATLKLPPYVSKLTTHLQKGVRGAEVDSENVRGDRYRFVVVAKKFEKWGHPERQLLVWNIAEKALSKAELPKVAMILTIAPSEMPGD